MYSSNLSYMIVCNQMNERLEEARRERLANAVNRPSFFRSLANQVSARLLRRGGAQAGGAINPEMPAQQTGVS